LFRQKSPAGLRPPLFGGYIEIDRDFSLVAPTDGHQSRTFNYSSPILIGFLGVHKNSSNFYEQV